METRERFPEEFPMNVIILFIIFSIFKPFQLQLY